MDRNINKSLKQLMLCSTAKKNWSFLNLFTGFIFLHFDGITFDFQI